MYKIPVYVDENGCVSASLPIPTNVIMTVMTATEVTVYDTGDELPMYDTGDELPMYDTGEPEVSV